MRITGTFDRTFIRGNFDGYMDIMEQMLEHVSNVDGMVAQNCRFYYSGDYQITPGSDMTLEEMATYGIGIFDALLFGMMWKIDELRKFCVWKRRDIEGTFEEETYSKVFFITYFLLMTRSKVKLDPEEKMPKFITDFCGIKISRESFDLHFGYNDISKMDHTWIRNMRWKVLGNSTVSRLKSGIAGTRLFNAIRTFRPDHNNIDKETMKVYSIIKDIADKGPYWTQHPLFYPQELRGVSILRNLQNLLLDLYNLKTLQKMNQTKMIFSIPNLDERYIQYKNWDDNFRNLFKEEDLVDLKTVENNNSNNNDNNNNNTNNSDDEQSDNEVITNNSPNVKEVHNRRGRPRKNTHKDEAVPENMLT